MDSIKITPEDVIYSCCSGFANCDMISLIACIEFVKELGFQKVSLGCLGVTPLNNKGVLNKAKTSQRIIVIDGCDNQCAKNYLSKQVCT